MFDVSFYLQFPKLAQLDSHRYIQKVCLQVGCAER